jgi:hypothetical protein
VAEERRRSRGAQFQSLMEEAGVSQSRRRLHSIVSLTLMVLLVVAVALVVVGLIVGGTLVWIGLALLAGTIVVMVVTALQRRRLVDNVRWQDATLTLRTVEPGDVGEAGQAVTCDIDLNPPADIARVKTVVGPLDATVVVVGATMRCLVDRTGGYQVLRAFPYAEPDAPLPNGRTLKFYKP